MTAVASSACQAKPPHYFTATLARGDVSDLVTATGTLSARTKVNVGSQASGIVAEVLVDFGDSVRRGDVLAKLDGRVVEAQLARAQATLTVAHVERQRAASQAANAERTLGRINTLKQDHMAAQADFETAELAALGAAAAVRTAMASVAQAEAELALARTNKALAQVVSPIDGVVIDRQVEVGQSVAAQFQVATLFTVAADMTQVQVQAAVDEADIGRVKVGLPATFTVDAYSGRTFEGVVQAIRPAPIPAVAGAQATAGGVVTYAAIIAAENPERLLLQGMTAQVSIVVRARHNVLLVPAAALRFRPNGPQDAADATKPEQGTPAPAAAPTAYVLAQGGKQAAPQARTLTLGLSDALMTEVTQGLEAGEAVIIAQHKDARGGRGFF